MGYSEEDLSDLWDILDYYYSFNYTYIKHEDYSNEIEIGDIEIIDYILEFKIYPKEFDYKEFERYIINKYWSGGYIERRKKPMWKYVWKEDEEND